MKKVINITAEDIRKAYDEKKRNGLGVCRTCPCALAAKRALKDKELFVGMDAIYSHKCIKLPRKAVKFVDRFTLGKSVRPIKFAVEVI